MTNYKIYIYLFLFFIFVGCHGRDDIGSVDEVHLHANKLARSGKYNDAVQYLEKNIKNENRDDKYFYHHGLYLELEDSVNNIHSYIDDYEKAYEINSEKYIIVKSLGSSYLIANEIDKAIELLEQAVLIFPEDSKQPNPFNSLSNAYMQKEEFDKAFDAVLNAIKYDSMNPILILRLGEIYGVSGDFESFKMQYRKAVEIDPDNMLIYNSYGNWLIRLKKFKEAEEFYIDLLKEHSDYWFCYADLAFLKLLQGKMENAKEFLEKSLTISPRDPYSKMYYAFYYYLLADYAAAFDYYKEYRLSLEKGILINGLKSVEEFEDYFSNNPLFRILMESRVKS